MKNFIPRQITPQTLRVLSRQFADYSKINPDSSNLKKVRDRVENLIKKLEANGAMPSVKESLRSHAYMSINQRDVKRSYLTEVHYADADTPGYHYGKYKSDDDTKVDETMKTRIKGSGQFYHRQNIFLSLRVAKLT